MKVGRTLWFSNVRYPRLTSSIRRHGQCNNTPLNNNRRTTTTKPGMQYFYKNAKDRISAATRKPVSPVKTTPLSLLNQQTHLLSPAFTVPAVLHPNPYSRIGLAATTEGLLLFPDSNELHGSTLPTKYVKMKWGATALAEEVDREGSDPPMELVVEVHVQGIIGTLDLFSCEYPERWLKPTQVTPLYRP